MCIRDSRKSLGACGALRGKPLRASPSFRGSLRASGGTRGPPGISRRPPWVPEVSSSMGIFGCLRRSSGTFGDLM
eukprot:9560610-Alexandrium_andersonii.AAC.1